MTGRALFPDSQEAQRAKQGLLERGVPANDVRLYDAEEVLSIASRLQQERSILPMLANSGKRAPIRSERLGVFC